MLTKFKKKTKSFSQFIWLILLVITTFLVTYFYENKKNSQYENLKKTLENVYFQKVFAKITSSLEERYLEYEHIVKEGDNYESIINNITIPTDEKKIFLETIKKNKK